MPITRDQAGDAFDRVYIDYAIQGTARVTWEIRRGFEGPAPWTFQLQANVNQSEPTEWVDVGAAVVDTFTTTDTTQRQFGSKLRIHYRVKLTDDEANDYYSQPATVLGELSEGQWLLARGIIRRARLKARRYTSYPGTLLKRRIAGTTCTTCYDPITHAASNSDCDECFGTGIVDGYWVAGTDTCIDMSPAKEDTRISERGTMNMEVVAGTFIALPIMTANDVWVLDKSDNRYIISSVTNMAEVNNVPILVRAELRLVPHSDVIYSVSLS